MVDKMLLAGCVILNTEGKVLLIHRNTPKRIQWETPGGKIEEGEDPQTTAEREAEEEIGVNIEVVRKLGRKEFTQDSFTMDYTWYLATVKSGEPRIMETEDYDSLKYFSWEELREMKDSISSNTKNLVDAYFNQEVNLN